MWLRPLVCVPVVVLLGAEELSWLLCFWAGGGFWAGVVFSPLVTSAAVHPGLLPARKTLELLLFFLSALLPSMPCFRWKSLGSDAWKKSSVTSLVRPELPGRLGKPAGAHSLSCRTGASAPGRSSLAFGLAALPPALAGASRASSGRQCPPAFGGDWPGRWRGG